MKKIIKTLFAVVMVLVLANSVYAAEPNGSITIKGTTTGKTYGLYRIFDATIAGSGDTAKVSYTINSKWTAFFNGVGAKYIVASNNAEKTLSKIVVNGQLKYININESNIAEFAKAAQDYTKGITADKEVTATGTPTVVSGLEYGYYLVFPYGATEVINPNASIVSLTTTKPNATVNVKATYPTIKKEADDTSVEVGQTVTYTIKGSVPDTTGYVSYTYKVSDSMTSGLTFNKNVTVTIKDKSYTNVTVDYDTVSNGFVLNINGLVGNTDITVGDEIVITYTATVNEAAINSVQTNKAKLEYSNNPKTDGLGETPEIEVVVYSTKITVTKVDGTDNNVKLAGAKFRLLNSDKTKYYVATMKDGKLVVSWTTNAADATVYTTDANGVVEFKGLEDGTYYLEETEAPEGYNKLTEKIEVKISHSAVKVDSTITATNTEVANYSGTMLPETGGMGTKLFVIIGTMMALVAGLVIVTNKRMAKEEI